MALPPPDAPLEKRLLAAALLAVTLPLWWPLLVGLLYLVWLLMGLVLSLAAVVLLAAPVAAIFGIEEKTTQRFDVEVEKDKVVDFKEAASKVGAKVEER